jgi:hypothetical protein|tara:strand:- start:29 stop:169 length:141 start_codon:yes stop_codon:yes gene_type:complete
MSSKQDEFLDKLETLCWNYSDREDGIMFKFFYMDVEDEGIDEDTDE